MVVSLQTLRNTVHRRRLLGTLGHERRNRRTRRRRFVAFGVGRGRDGRVDRGVGGWSRIPPDFDLGRHANVGLALVRTLAERDLNGKLTLASGPGVTAQVWFPW
jgi:hypothetical protein